MTNKEITIELGDRLKPETESVLRDFTRNRHGIRIADARINISVGKGASAQNGTPKGSGRDYSLELHTRVIAGERMHAAGYFGISLGPTDVPNFSEIVRSALEKSYERAMHCAKNKFTRKSAWGELGKTLWSTDIASIPVHQNTVPAEFSVWPLDVPLEAVTDTAHEISKELKTLDRRLKQNFIGIATWVERELYVSSEGASIDQTFCYTQGMAYVVAVSDGGVTQEHYDYLGHQRGWEVIENGIRDEFFRFPNLRQFSLDLARDACVLTACPPCPWTEKPVPVVTDPHFNALKVHEIVGHPTELDRILKMETAYAGRSWLFKSPDENLIGKRIGSSLVNAFSDPSLPGYGHYAYDHEGTPARRVWHVKKGILVGFMNSRQTSAIMQDEPNGHWKANGGQVVPLIRMSNTVFEKGTSEPEDIIKDVDHGYYLVGHRTPSIAESRENFRITARKVYEITDGKIGQMYRDGGIMADTYDYFMSVDAVGDDFRLFPIPNCGKGQPMQTKRLGNGGPTMRAYAKLTGGANS